MFGTVAAGVVEGTTEGTDGSLRNPPFFAGLKPRWRSLSERLSVFFPENKVVSLKIICNKKLQIICVIFDIIRILLSAR